jgi:precorrin-6A/cobalt-precorrin-6A reductase
MKILVLGGIAESKRITQQLIERGHEVIYSIVGLVRQPDLRCELHIGGFSSQDKTGAEGLGSYCLEHKIDLLLDATHPYAVRISANAVVAAKKSQIDCWRYTRPGWGTADYLSWHDFDNWDDLIPQIGDFQHPFFSTGASILEQLDRRPAHQQWIVRSARKLPDIDGIITINKIGPFNYEDELSLMRQYNVDVLISKNSGGLRLAGKLDAAHSLGIPVFVQRRPALARPDKCFERIEDLLAEIPEINTREK